MRSSIRTAVVIFAIVGWCVLNRAEAAASADLAGPLRVIFTADTEGHLTACQSCPGPVGQGSLSRRATALRQLRAAGPLLVLDGGNGAFGDETVASQGGAIITAYDALGYDALNVCYRDFTFGKAQALKLFGGAKGAAVSANLLDAATGEPLFHPYTVRPFGGGHVAVIGLTEAPAGLAVLPRLKRQLDGVRIDSPDAALTKWLPRAKAEADQVVLMFYGSPTALNAISAESRKQCAAILLGGVRPYEIAAGAAHVYAAEQHGRSLTLVTSGTMPDSRQILLDNTVPHDADMDVVLAKYAAAPIDLPLVAVATLPVAQPSTNVAPAAPSPSSSSGEMLANVSPPTAATAIAVKPAEPSIASPPVKVVKRVTAHSDLKPQGLAGVKLTEAQVNAAIDRGSAFLWNYLKTEDMGKHGQKLGDAPEHLLAMLALVHADAIHKFPDFEPALHAYLTRPKSYTSMGTYEVGLLCMLIESYGDPAFFNELHDAAQYLVDSQGPQGTWTYSVGLPDDEAAKGRPGQVLLVLAGNSQRVNKTGIARRHDWTFGRDGDSSCAQFAILGLHSSSRCNNPIVNDVWTLNLAANTRRQIATEGSWGYQEEEAGGYGSMTCAGICAVAIDRYELQQTPAEVDPRIERGIGWLDDHFSVSDNPNHSGYTYYYLYSLERVGRVLDTEFIGSHEWYPLGARFLVDKQMPDGKWLDPTESPDEPRIATSFALLFLTRATPKLQPVEKHGGPGTLRAQVQSPPPTRIYIILDASGSMIEEMKGQSKFDIARQAVTTLIDALPDTTQVALRVYGNHKTSLDKDSDSDTTLEIPMGTLDRKAFAAKLKSLRARGKTPLTLSLTDAMSELPTSAADPATMLLLTDGGEDTFPRRNPVKAADELAKQTGLTFQIVGFDINQADWGEQLRAMAEHGHGFYWPAAGADDLPAQLAAAVFGKPIGFSVLDAQGKLITQGHFGQPITLPEGRYGMRTAYAGRDFDAAFAIQTDGTTAILFDATQIAASGGPVPAVPAPAPAESVAPRGLAARFCTHCGGPLPPGAKFCPKCGEPVPH